MGLAQPFKGDSLVRGVLVDDYQFVRTLANQVRPVYLADVFQPGKETSRAHHRQVRRLQRSRRFFSRNVQALNGV